MTDDTPSPPQRAPIETRFKKGVSGNPKGRPKGSKNKSTIFKKVADVTIPVNKMGRRTTITRLEASFEQLANKAAGGDLKAIKMFCDMYERYYKSPTSDSQISKESADPTKPLTEEEIAKRYLEALKNAKSDE